ncbi:MAG: V-type ATP synthase subunit E [Oscillospiraceae bacterium]|nr:V-type ATP synthase subunit E [Oscillospiraceae bacterium]
MAGLNKIIERIAQDSAAKCDGIIFDAQNEATKIKEAAVIKVNDDKNAIIDAANKEAKAIVDMAESGAQLEGKKVLLATRVEIIEKAIAMASEKLASMPEEEYFAAIYALVKNYAQAADGQMLLSKKDLGRLPSDFEKKINADLKGGKITVSKDPADISEGFILVYGDIEINCTFDALIADAKDDIKDELYNIIFA